MTSVEIQAVDRTSIIKMKSLDEVLRCAICFDYFNVCMMTACSHNYCSLCIRRYFTYKAECPICFEEASEPELKNNRLIDEIVQRFLALRDTLELINKGVEDSEICDNVNFAGNKYKMNIDKKQLHKYESLSYSADDKDNVACPVCNLLFPMTKINLHLDSCLKESEEKVLPSSQEKRKPLPKVVYFLLSDKNLKKRLTEFGLSTKGDRETLVKRHKAFLILYNAECDSLNPRPVSEIIEQVERELQEEAVAIPSIFEKYDRRIDPSVVEEDQQKYMKTYQKQFKMLIENVRKREEGEEPISETISKTDDQLVDIDSKNEHNQSSINSVEVSVPGTSSASALPTVNADYLESFSPELFEDDTYSDVGSDELVLPTKIFPPPNEVEMSQKENAIIEEIDTGKAIFTDNITSQTER